MKPQGPRDTLGSNVAAVVLLRPLWIIQNGLLGINHQGRHYVAQPPPELHDQLAGVRSVLVANATVVRVSGCPAGRREHHAIRV